MAFAGRLRSTLPLIRKIAAVDSLSSAQRSAPITNLISPPLTTPPLSRNYATASDSTEKKIKLPLILFGFTGNYASALYMAAVRVGVLDKVESELLDFVAAAKNSSTFSQFMKDLSISKDARLKAMTDICENAKFSEITSNFLAVLAENGRLKDVEKITQRFTELTMAHRGEVKAIVTTVTPLPAQKEKELVETLEDILGEGKKVILEQKVDPSILGGIVVEFDQKLFDMSIKTRARKMEEYIRDPVNYDALFEGLN